MCYKQNEQRYSSNHQQHHPTGILQPADQSKPRQERQLVELWQQHNVSQSYQSIVLQYLDQLRPAQLSKQISNQLQHIYHKSSFFHKIQFLLSERQASLHRLQECCEGMGESCQGQEEQIGDLQRVCDLVDYVRKTSMCISESVWEMFQYFGCRPGNQTQGRHYISLLAHFDQDWQCLKHSLIRYYIPFTTAFDPLLIEAARSLRRFYSLNKIVYSRHIDQLFRLNASYFYRLLRAHQRISRMHMLAQDLEATEDSRPTDYQPHYQDTSLTNHGREEYKPEIYKSRKPQTELRNRRRAQRHKQEDKDKQENKDKQQVIGRVVNKLSYGQQVLGQQSEPLVEARGQQKKDRRRIMRIAQITINNSKHKLHPSYISAQDGLINKQPMPQKKLQTQESQKEIVHSANNHPSITEAAELTVSQLSSRNQFINQDVPPIRHLKPPKQPVTLQKDRHLSKDQELDNERSPQLKRKRSRTVHLPKVAQKEAEHNHKDTSDCQCRLKYKSHKLKQPYIDLPVEQVERRRQTIIKRINEKYRELAKKQIRYELSMMGDLTYHRMKDRITESRLKLKPKKAGVHMTQKQVVTQH